MKTINYSKLARQTAILSFVVGTIFFIIDQLVGNFDIKIYGLMYIFIAFSINIGVLVRVLFEAMYSVNKRKDLLLHSSLMLLNIPVVIVYMSLM